jgi:hypothetical protein
MDTDDLSEMGWEIIARAAQVSDTLKVDLGARSSRYRNEDDWLRGVAKFMQEIVEDPAEVLVSIGFRSYVTVRIAIMFTGRFSVRVLKVAWNSGGIRSMREGGGFVPVSVFLPVK